MRLINSLNDSIPLAFFAAVLFVCGMVMIKTFPLVSLFVVCISAGLGIGSLVVFITGLVWGRDLYGR